MTFEENFNDIKPICDKKNSNLIQESSEIENNSTDDNNTEEKENVQQQQQKSDLEPAGDTETQEIELKPVWILPPAEDKPKKKKKGKKTKVNKED